MNRYNLLLFYLYQFFSKASFQRGIFILYLTELGFSGAQIGTLQALLFWSNLLSEVPTGIFGDRYGRKLSVITGLALFAVNGIGQVLFGGFLPFLVIYALQGIAFAFCSGSDEAMIYDYLKSIGAESKYIKVQSRLRAIGSLSLGTAMCVGGVLQGYSWKAVYCSYSLAMLAGLMSIIFFSDIACLKKSETDAESEVTQSFSKQNIQFIKLFFNNKSLLFMLCASALLSGAITPYFIFAQKLFSSYGAKPFLISLIFSIVEISSGIFSLTAQWFLKILSFRALVICTFIGSSVLMVLNLIPSLGLAVFLFFVMMTIPEIADVLIHAYFQKQISSETRASALSFISFVQSAVIGISYAFYGILLDKFTTRFAVALTAIFPLLSAIFAFIALYKMQISVDLEVS